MFPLHGCLQHIIIFRSITYRAGIIHHDLSAGVLPAQKIDFPLSAVPEFNRPETSLQHFLTDPAIGQQLKIIIFFPDVFFIKCTAFCPLRRLMRKQKAKIKPDKRITDLICTGQHLLHQLQFHQILQIYTDLGPGKSGMCIHIVQFSMSSVCQRCQNGVINCRLPRFLRQPFYHKLRQKAVPL